MNIEKAGTGIQFQRGGGVEMQTRYVNRMESIGVGPSRDGNGRRSWPQRLAVDNNLPQLRLLGAGRGEGNETHDAHSRGSVRPASPFTRTGSSNQPTGSGWLTPPAGAPPNFGELI